MWGKRSITTFYILWNHCKRWNMGRRAQMGIKEEKAVLYTLMDLFCFPKWNNCYGLQKTNSKCSPWGSACHHSTTPSYTRGSFWWCLTPLPLPIHMPHSITELKQQNLSHDSFRLRGLPREYVKKQFAYVTTYLYGILYRKNVLSE